MKKYIILSVILIASFTTIWYSCKKESIPTPDPFMERIMAKAIKPNKTGKSLVIVSADTVITSTFSKSSFDTTVVWDFAVNTTKVPSPINEWIFNVTDTQGKYANTTYRYDTGYGLGANGNHFTLQTSQYSFFQVGDVVTVSVQAVLNLGGDVTQPSATYSFTIPYYSSL